MSPPPWDEPWEGRHGQEQDWSSYPNRPKPNSHSGPPKTTNLSRKWSRRHAHNIINEQEQELSNARQGGETKVSQCARPVRQGRGRAHPDGALTLTLTLNPHALMLAQTSRGNPKPLTIWTVVTVAFSTPPLQCADTRTACLQSKSPSRRRRRGRAHCWQETRGCSISRQRIRPLPPCQGKGRQSCVAPKRTNRARQQVAEHSSWKRNFAARTARW